MRVRGGPRRLPADGWAPRENAPPHLVDVEATLCVGVVSGDVTRDLYGRVLVGLLEADDAGDLDESGRRAGGEVQAVVSTMASARLRCNEPGSHPAVQCGPRHGLADAARLPEAGTADASRSLTFESPLRTATAVTILLMCVRTLKGVISMC